MDFDHREVDDAVGTPESLDGGGIANELELELVFPFLPHHSSIPQWSCWYGKLISDGCGGLKPQREGTTARRAMQTKCRDPKVSFNKLFADKAVTEEERM